MASLLTDAAANGGGWAARIGGDEFILIFPDLSLEQAEPILSALSRDIREHLFYKGDTHFSINASMGIKEYHPAALVKWTTPSRGLSVLKSSVFIKIPLFSLCLAQQLLLHVPERLGEVYVVNMRVHHALEGRPQGLFFLHEPVVNFADGRFLIHAFPIHKHRGTWVFFASLTAAVVDDGLFWFISEPP